MNPQENDLCCMAAHLTAKAPWKCSCPCHTALNRRDDTSCAWTIDDWGGDSTCETACGQTFVFEEGGPESNGFRFCGYCGKPLVEVYTSTLREADDDDHDQAKPDC